MVPVRPELTLTEQNRGWLRTRPLMLPLILAVVGILAVALVAAVVLALAGNEALPPSPTSARPDDMDVIGSGFFFWETVDVVLDGGTVTGTPQVRPGGQFNMTFTRPTSIPVGRTVEIVATGSRIPRVRTHVRGVRRRGAADTVRTQPPIPYDVTCVADGVRVPTARNREPVDPCSLTVPDAPEEVKLTDGSRLWCIDVDTGAIGTIPGQSALAGRTVSASTWAPASGDIAFTHRATNDSNSDRDIDILTADGRLEPLVDDGNDDFLPGLVRDGCHRVRAGRRRSGDGSRRQLADHARAPGGIARRAH